MYTKSELLDAAGITDRPDYLDRVYESFAAKGVESYGNDFPSQERMEHLCALIDVPVQAASAVSEVADFILEDKQRSCVAAFIVWLMIDGIRTWENDIVTPPVPYFCEGNEDLAKCFHLFLVFVALDRGTHQREAKGFDHEYVKLPLADVRSNIILNYLLKGKWAATNLNWVMKSASQTMTRQGSFQCVPHRMTDLYGTVYTEPASRKTVFICDAGIPVSESGQRLPAGFPDAAFVTSLAQDGTILRGHPVHPSGRIERETVCLDMVEWKRSLSRGDTALEMHIPKDAPYDADHLRDSFEKALTFYKTYYPEIVFEAVCCVSWLFSPQLRYILSNPESKILKVQKQVYITPQCSGTDVFYEFIFGTPNVDIHTVECSTSLQRNLVSRVRSGQPLNWGSFFYLMADMDEWGTDMYLRHYPFIEPSEQ